MLTRQSKRVLVVPGNALAVLRALVPEEELTFEQAERLTEQQADGLRDLLQVATARLPDATLRQLPRVRIEESHLFPVRASHRWQDGNWVITVNGQEPQQRQRLSIGRELWHIINYRTSRWLCPQPFLGSPTTRAERLAEQFALCLLVSASHLERLADAGLTASELASVFDVPTSAVVTRLRQLRSAEPCRRGILQPAAAA